MNEFVNAQLVLFMIIFCYASYQAPCLFSYVNAHIFVSSDDNAAFLTLIERVRIEALLANDSLHSNLTSSNEHLAQLLDRLDDVIHNENYFVVKSEQFSNSTVDALFLANVVMSNVMMMALLWHSTTQESKLLLKVELIST